MELGTKRACFTPDGFRRDTFRIQSLRRSETTKHQRIDSEKGLKTGQLNYAAHDEFQYHCVIGNGQFRGRKAPQSTA